MGLDYALILSLAVGVVTTLGRLLQDSEKLRPFSDRIRRNKTLVMIFEMMGIEIAIPKESYQARLQNLLAKFTEVSAESETIVEELQTHILSKETVVKGLEQKEKELAARIDQMKETPEFAVARIQELTEEIVRLQKESQRDQAKDSRRSALRDFALFTLGVLVPYMLGWLAPKIGIVLPAMP